MSYIKYSPYKSFRVGQEKTIHDIISAFEKEHQVVELNAPTAAGKTVILYCVGRILEKEFGMENIRFTSPQSGGGDSTLPYRNAREHGNRLYGKLQSLLTSQTELISENESLNKGIYLEVSGAQGTALNIESLEDLRKNIRLANLINMNFIDKYVNPSLIP